MEIPGLILNPLAEKTFVLGEFLNIILHLRLRNDIDRQPSHWCCTLVFLWLPELHVNG